MNGSCTFDYKLSRLTKMPEAPISPETPTGWYSTPIYARLSIREPKSVRWRIARRLAITISEQHNNAIVLYRESSAQYSNVAATRAVTDPKGD